MVQSCSFFLDVSTLSSLFGVQEKQAAVCYWWAGRIDPCGQSPQGRLLLFFGERFIKVEKAGDISRAWLPCSVPDLLYITVHFLLHSVTVS